MKTQTQWFNILFNFLQIIFIFIFPICYKDTLSNILDLPELHWKLGYADTEPNSGQSASHEAVARLTVHLTTHQDPTGHRPRSD